MAGRNRHLTTRPGCKAMEGLASPAHQGPALGLSGRAQISGFARVLAWRPDVYINGKQVAALKRWTSKYEIVPIADSDRNAIKAGVNILAVHCHQDAGGQFIDVHVVDASKVPELPPAKRSSKPYVSELVTSWGSQVNSENVWAEYPRPQLRRSKWDNLNGQWDYAITEQDQNLAPNVWAGKILVPFCLESKLSGVGRLLLETEALWYRRTFNATPSPSERLLLHFEAVDYECEAFVNGKSVGKHRGGNTPFSFDISSAIQLGENTLVLRVDDDTEKYQLRGKQVFNAHGIWYTQVSGIWQTVWLESVPKAYIEDLKIYTDAKRGSIDIKTIAVGGENARVRVVVRERDQQVAESVGNTNKVSIQISNAKLWSPSSPHLYDLEISLLDAQGKVLDRVESYAGIRSVGKHISSDGHLRFTLNGQEIFHWGPLDQGWWPDGLLTPPSDTAMKFDIEFLKSAGFNMIRKHIKVEPRRYYYHCDRIGMMMWQDQVSAGHSPKWTRLEPNPEDASWPDAEHQQFMLELDRMINNLESHPCIVVWVPYNEAWGQHRTVEVGEWTVKRDPTRLVNIASGGNFWPVGDIVDHHQYPHPEYPFNEARDRGFIKVLGEFGGHGYPVKNHMWKEDNRIWGYGGLPKSEEEFRERYATSIDKLNALRRKGIAAGVYTQTTDVEAEINGLMTYDRKVIKISATDLAKMHSVLFKP
jgi:Glycosyl hydrolases family 2/Glycosyl hydrolases family 2, sugar binding domain/Glycosyl hydrolases family 2, TIM barrel domain